MFKPKFTYTDKIVNNLIKIENHKVSISKNEFSYEVKSKLNQKTKVLDMFHFSHVLGLSLTLKDAEKLTLSRSIEVITDERKMIVSNFRNVHEFARSNMADTYSEVDPAVMLHINKLLLNGWRESWDVKFRNVIQTIDSRWDDWIQFRETDIPEGKTENEIMEAIEWYKSEVPTLPAILRTAIFIYRLIEISPFVAGNKITIMALCDYMLLKNGFSSKIFSSTSRIFDSHSENILEGLTLSKKSYNINHFVERFTESIVKELLITREEINKIVVVEENAKKQPFLDLNKRQIKVLNYLQKVPTIKREDYCHLMDVSTMTAFRDLNDLVRKKLLRLEGQGRGTKYRLSSM